MSPDQLGKYRVVRVLGQGAMGTVYLAEDPLIGRQLAIKVMKSAGEEERFRFIHEARIVGSFSHPNIVVVHDFGFENEQPYLVMELVEGEGLDVWLKASHPLEAHLKVADGLCSALEYAHARDVLHRDLKPSNVQVLPDGGCKLMDFGIARGAESLLTATGTVMGTPAYMAPEILESAQYSVGSDIYGTGVVLYEMLSQRNPFLAPTVAATLTNVLRVQPEPIFRVRPEVPRELGKAIMSCLEKDPARRPASLAPLLAALRSSHHPDDSRPPVSATQSVLVPPRAGTLPPISRSRRRSATLWVLALALPMSMIAGWLAINSRREPVAEPSPPGRPAEMPMPASAAALASAAVPSPTPGTAIPTPAATKPPAPRATASPTPPGPTPGAAVVSVEKSEPRPTPSPLGAATPPVTTTDSSPPASNARPPTGAEVRAEHAGGGIPPLATLQSLSPRTSRRGLTVTVELHGTGLRSDHRVQVLRGRQAASGIRVTRQQPLGPLVTRVTLLIEEDAPLGDYSIVVVDGEGAHSNALSLEVVL